MLLVPGIQMVGRGVRGSLDGGTSQGVGTHQSRAGGGVNVGFNESSTATSGQDTALCGHQAARQYAILPPFHSFSSSLLLPRDGLHSVLCGSSVVHLIIMCFKAQRSQEVRSLQDFFSSKTTTCSNALILLGRRNANWNHTNNFTFFFFLSKDYTFIMRGFLLELFIESILFCVLVQYFSCANRGYFLFFSAKMLPVNFLWETRVCGHQKLSKTSYKMQTRQLASKLSMNVYLLPKCISSHLHW